MQKKESCQRQDSRKERRKQIRLCLLLHLRNKPHEIAKVTKKQFLMVEYFSISGNSLILHINGKS
jgi:hypothetical protein